MGFKEVHNLETGQIEKESISMEKFLELHSTELAIANKKRKSAEEERDKLVKRVKIVEEKHKEIVSAKKEQETLNETLKSQVMQIKMRANQLSVAFRNKQGELNASNARIQQFKSLAQNS